MVMVWCLQCVVTAESFPLAVAEAAISQGKGLANVVLSAAQFNMDKE